VQKKSVKLRWGDIIDMYSLSYPAVSAMYIYKVVEALEDREISVIIIRSARIVM